MMKSKVKTKQDNFSQNDNKEDGANQVDIDKKNKKQDPNVDLMHRLALGKKV